MALTVSATDSEVPLPVNTVFQQRFLRNARPLAPYYLGSMAGRISREEGAKQVTWRRFNTSMDNASGISPTTSALSEVTTASYMQGQTPDTVHRSDVTATVAKYGQFYILSEEVLTFNPGGSFEQIVDTMSISGGRSLNQLQRNVLEDNATAIHSGGASSDGAVTSGITLNDIRNAVNALDKNAAMPFAPMTSGDTNIGTAPISQSYWGLTHPDVAQDVSKLPGFHSIETYNGQVATMDGEFGSLTVGGTSVRFVKSPDASVDSDAGGTQSGTGLQGTSSVDLYSTVIYGRDAWGSVGLGRMYPDGMYRAGESDIVELITKGPGVDKPSGTDDPFDEVTTVAWKAWHAGAQLNSNWSRVIRSGATDLTA